ncbi:amidohydrolase [Myxococcus landrumensis]|uniref:Amidohydrolase n=1 Tax=Myxococcus landrumensis TaxID=2813577 RepID=A0ABX7N130_9BACT|nr:amidohydrolase [Myxococcus landrumus]QSQ11329.1 amidohydrolase [Myxococcus landrumus]
MLRRLCGLVGAVIVFSGLGGCTRNTPGAGASGTSVYVAQRIRTLDAARPVVEALAVRDGKVLATGTREEVLQAAGPGARVVDLGEVTVVPGLTDAHGHLAGLGQAEAQVSLVGAASKQEALSRIASAPTTSYQGAWLIGQGWDQNDWPEKAFPTRQDLDAIHSGVPVMLSRIDGHAAWVNSEALRRAGITRDTKDPTGGRILRDASGEATGILLDNAMDLVGVVVPALSDAEHATHLGAALARVARVGLTGVHDAGMDLRTFRLLQKWDKEGKLPLRVYAMAAGQGAERDTFLREGPYQGNRLTLRAVKLVLDGALGSRGAALHQDYTDEHGHRGLLMMPPDEYERRVTAFMAAGFQVCTHAIGDRANTLVLDTLLRAAEVTGAKDGRHRVEHAQVMRLEDIDRLGKSGFVASVQPMHATSDMPWAEARVGPERIRGAYAWQRLKASGAVLALGSDFPVERPDVLAGLYAARTRQDASGAPANGWYADQRLSAQEALEGFTVGAAYASFAESRRGRLQPGMDADFVVLSVDPVDAPVAQLPGAQVRLTVVGGDEVFRAEEK